VLDIKHGNVYAFFRLASLLMILPPVACLDGEHNTGIEPHLDFLPREDGEVLVKIMLFLRLNDHTY
jgi:hypothetical protein